MNSEGAARRWLSTGDLCERYGVERHTIRRWERQGKIPKADRTRGQPKWWGPLVEAHDVAREPAVVVGSAPGSDGGGVVAKLSAGVHVNKAV